MSGTQEGDRVETRLRRLEELVDDLGRITDPVSRAHVRELFEMLLDSYGVAMARLIARLAKTADGRDALAELGSDPQVRPIILLHGLHPDDVETRLRQAAASLRKQGTAVTLGPIANRAATVRLDDDDDALRERVAAALYEAAPELEGVIFDGDDRAALKADLDASPAS